MSSDIYSTILYRFLCEEKLHVCTVLPLTVRHIHGRSSRGGLGGGGGGVKLLHPEGTVGDFAIVCLAFKRILDPPHHSSDLSNPLFIYILS